MPALQLPDEVAAVLRSYYTCEVTTVNGKGQPTTWPARLLRRGDGRDILLRLHRLPVKAQNARKRPQVSAALLSTPPAPDSITRRPCSYRAMRR